MQEQPTSGAPAPLALDRVADVVSMASDFGVVWIVVTALQVLSGRSSAIGAAKRLAAAGFTSLVLTRVLKHRFAIARPEPDPAPVARLAREPRTTGFPSGHTLAAFASAIAIPRSSRGRAWAVVFAMVVGWARVRVGHHRYEDVVAGAVAGSVAGAVIVATAAAVRTAA